MLDRTAARINNGWSNFSRPPTGNHDTMTSDSLCRAQESTDVLGVLQMIEQ
jgi:hypothetical protein